MDTVHVIFLETIMKMALWYVKQILLAVDQLFNAILGGYADESMSSRAWRAYVRKHPLGLFFKPLIDTLFFFQKDHCYKAYLSERKQSQLPPEDRSINPDKFTK